MHFCVSVHVSEWPSQIVSDKVHLRWEIEASRPPGGDPRHRKRDSDAEQWSMVSAYYFRPSERRQMCGCLNERDHPPKGITLGKFRAFYNNPALNRVGGLIRPRDLPRNFRHLKLNSTSPIHGEQKSFPVNKRRWNTTTTASRIQMLCLLSKRLSSDFEH